MASEEPPLDAALRRMCSLGHKEREQEREREQEHAAPVPGTARRRCWGFRRSLRPPREEGVSVDRPLP